MNNIIKFFAVAALGLSFASCEDVLDVNNEKKLSDQAVWSSESSADQYITASYKIFSDDAQLAGCRSKFWDACSDLVKSSSWSQYGHPYNQFLLQGISNGDAGAGIFECWSNYYTRIRRANACLYDLHSYGTKFGDDWVTPRDAEIRLCRAYAYFMLARVYGGVIIRTHNSGSQGGLDDGVFEADIARPRATEAETYRFILDELNAAAEALPEKISATWLRGRATKAFAYGLISRIALYAGLWNEAAAAAEKVAQQPGVDLDPNFANLFTPDGATSPEYIFCLRYMTGKITHDWDNSVSPAGDNAINNTGAYGEHQPTAELCDLYEWADGTAFDWSTWDQNHANPFTDREPRFQATVLYNGADWRGRKIEPFEGGVDGFQEFARTTATGGKSCTGYFFRKFLQEDNMGFNTTHSTVPDPTMRYAEVLLNQAEAYANIDHAANAEKILTCINKIRERVNLPAKTRADINSFDDCMEIIRNERAKELVGEGFRFWDLRRWRLAESVIGGKMVHGVKIKPNGAGFTYERIQCDDNAARIYQSRYNYFSIPMSERSNNTACTNNPGW